MMRNSLSYIGNFLKRLCFDHTKFGDGRDVIEVKCKIKKKKKNEKKEIKMNQEKTISFQLDTLMQINDAQS